ncbi:hypothetical protein [Sediminivirga luteola]|uniref:hypothetical protein n=1 Tax=Sediminivirga luteola TaxID=1774748 RepID=UPI001F5669ED|nr:hypothetical protein [Sediminivirga luteola]MCI2266338.1 hypothetical protein [Sediminivirga luteola]
MFAQVSRTVVALIAVAVLLGGCVRSEEAGDEPAGQAPGTAESEAPESRFMLALRRVPAPRGDLWIEFGDVQRLGELADSDPGGAWDDDVRHLGLGALAPRAHLTAGLGLDVRAAELAIASGGGSERAGALLGGQDADAVYAAARAQGWEGETALSRDEAPAEPMTTALGHLIALQDDVLYTAAGVEPSWDSVEDLAAEDPEVRAYAACLGEVAAAVIAGDVAVGVRPDDAGVPVTLMCTSGPDPDELAASLPSAVEGTSRVIEPGTPYSRHVAPPDTEILDQGMVRAAMRHRPGTGAGWIFTLLRARDLPGTVQYRGEN